MSHGTSAEPQSAAPVIVGCGPCYAERALTLLCGAELAGSEPGGLLGLTLFPHQQLHWMLPFLSLAAAMMHAVLLWKLRRVRSGEPRAALTFSSAS